MRSPTAERLLAAALLLAASPAVAERRISFEFLSPSSPAIVHEPAERGPKSRVALVTIHPYANYIGHSSCANMADRGYVVVCANTPYANNQYGYDSVERMFPTIKAAVARARKAPGVEKVLLIGHSAGAPMMAYYQNVAEHGPAACRAPERIAPCDEALARDLPKADGLVLLDPHLGDAFATLAYVDPAIVDEARPAARDKSLDLYDPANGYDPATRRAAYPEAFRKSFLAAQAARNNELVESARAFVAGAPEGAYADDAPFVVPGATAARLWQPDTSLLRRTRREYTLLKGDGSTPAQVLTSLRVPSGSAKEATGYGSVLEVSVRNFLGAHAIRALPDYNQTEDDITGVDWDSSNTSTLPNIRGVTVPLLIEVMTGHYFLRPGEMILDAAGSKDKEMVGVEGAAHVITPCEPCATTPGQFGDTVKRAYDHLDGWLSKRF
jgi:pimeloyl-ACP methyl ester carboxylesterase